MTLFTITIFHKAFQLECFFGGHFPLLKNILTLMFNVQGKIMIPLFEVGKKTFLVHAEIPSTISKAQSMNVIRIINSVSLQQWM